MLKKLDAYILKTFLGPFFFIFSILFFIFIVQFAWQEMGKFIGKGLEWYIIVELLFYLGINVIQLVLPLTILLGSIMTFGGFGERYELAAMKASGIPLMRIIGSIFGFVFCLSVGLYFFGDQVMPLSQRKAKNLLFSIIQTKPTMQIKEGVFIDAIPGFQLKVNTVSGENNEFLEDVFVHQNAGFGENTMTILAKNGVLKADKEDNRFLKLELFNGTAYTDNIQGKNILQRQKQQNQSTKFDTLNYYFDITDLIEKKDDQNNVSDHYKFLNGGDLKKMIDSTAKDFDKLYKEEQTQAFDNNFYYAKEFSKVDSLKIKPNKNIQSFSPKEKDHILTQAIQTIKRDKENADYLTKQIYERDKYFAKINLHYYRNLSYAVTCVIFFLIGSSLGSIVKKGGIGMPVIISIIIFVVYFVINFSAENMAKNGNISSFIAAWMANIIAFPIAIVLCYNANKDSALFDSSKYIDPIVDFVNRFRKKKQNTEEHSRYQ
jgi:lipopolysaccharide export system permease protein